jgi:hypothetical protein
MASLAHEEQDKMINKLTLGENLMHNKLSRSAAYRPKLVSLGAFLCILALSPLAHAAPYPVIAQDVGVCDPNSPLHCVAPDSSGNIPVVTRPSGATSTDASGTVTLGGTYQTAIAASSIRKGCLIQNPTTAVEALNVRVGATTVFNLLAGGTFSCASGSIVVTDAITITAPTTGHAFSAVYQ